MLILYVIMKLVKISYRKKENLLFVKHSFFYNKSNKRFPYERNMNSTAGIPIGHGKYYVCGGINGGKAKDYLQMCEELKYRIDLDDKKGIIARWHDESHINRYLYEEQNTYKMLNSSYCFPEHRKNSPFKPILFFRNKEKYIDIKKIKNSKALVNRKNINKKKLYKRKKIIGKKIIKKEKDTYKNNEINYYKSIDILGICTNNKYINNYYESNIDVFERYCLNCYDGKKINNSECVNCPYNRMLNSIKILSSDDTLNEIIKNNRSIARFGDYEFKIIFGEKCCKYQKSNEKLAKRLKEILQSNEENLLIGICDSINMNYLNKLRKQFKKIFKKFILKNKFSLLKILNTDKQYYSANISRFYIYFIDRSNTLNYVKKLKKVWNNRNILIVEGEQTRLGIGNDLFNNTKSIERILCPAENAFNVYDSIYNEVIKNEKNKLILIALGPTATVLSYDLNKVGYQAIDIGHMDLEYEWFIRGVKNRINIKNKYVNGVKNGAKNIKNVEDQEYYKQIIADISK